MLNTYNEHGYVVLKNVLDNQFVKDQAEHFHRLREIHTDIEPDEISSHLLQNDRVWYSLISHPSLLNIAALFIGKDIAHFYSRYFAKRPGTGREVPWHQDGAYYPLEPVRLCTLWLSLTHSTPESGCLKVIPGTHNSQLYAISEATDKGSI